MRIAVRPRWPPKKCQEKIAPLKGFACGYRVEIGSWKHQTLEGVLS
jgi:hypothetical protein